MRKLHLLLILALFQFHISAQVDPYSPDPNPPAVLPGYKLSWSDEFNYTGKPSSANWSYETGFVRNEEHQWYQSDNANVSNGTLQITGRKERVKNPNYQSGSSDWKKNREYAEYTSSAIHTRGKQSWKYGRFEIRAKIPATTGAWPAIWTLGNWGDWPTNGEIDILEYYGDGILANAAWGSSQAWVGTWDSSKTPMSYFKGKDANWANKYHIWVMDWTPEFIKLYVDGELLNTIETYKTLNTDGSNPFTSRNHYVLLNLALGGVNGGDPSKPNYPITYYVDYFRVYQPDNTDSNCFQ
ncbi:MAG: glycoside hydrolase family 16 protein, partial [Paludibacter sp.]|nr:glycoside hydrolase family 16 protein [Paludibacter sp.]